uniref:CWC25 spliceosome associated protein homolog n=1 Tax=Cyanistes caeruleus TaxID=156563 RepID=A0A8C0ZJ58_CYACU
MKPHPCYPWNCGMGGKGHQTILVIHGIVEWMGRDIKTHPVPPPAVPGCSRLSRATSRDPGAAWNCIPGRNSLLPFPSGLQVRDPEPSRRSRSSPCQERPRQRSRSSSRSPQSHSSRRNPARSSGSPCRHSRQHSSREEKGRARSPSPKKSFRRQQPSGYTRKISPEELERKRQEMMENAKWREEERANNLRKHRKEEELERELEKLDARDGKFFHRLKLESASTSSLEDRVKRNIHSLQRTPAALEKNFMQR